uniref:Uncharacterized protein n=1 Tax=Arundo donax TaxID=35708 RepID=A0A0A9FFU8_ARUDO
MCSSANWSDTYHDPSSSLGRTADRLVPPAGSPSPSLAR